MVQGAYNFEEIAAQLVALFKDSEIRVERLYLYGSQASGKAHSGSDVDIVLISKDLEKFPPLKRLELFGRIAWKCTTPVEIIGYTPDEVKDKKGKSIFWDEVLSTGRIIYKAA